METLRLRSPETRLYRREDKAWLSKIVREPGTYPNVVSFREPHPGQNMRPPMLRESLRKLLLSPEEFMRILEDC